VSAATRAAVGAALRSVLAATGLTVFGLSTAFAQVVADPNAGAHRPTVIQTANGIQQVNVTRPSAAGVSINGYTQFDVPKAGVVLNNSPTIVNTQQAGYINGNPNFGANQSAKIIVNQVNSRAASQINGYVEVAGNRAEVVIANGSGISVNGGGFINTSRAILTTGTPDYGADGSLTGFNVTGGSISIQGAGLNASNVDQVDLISRAVQVNAAIYAKNLSVVTGANSVDHDTLRFGPTLRSNSCGIESLSSGWVGAQGGAAGVGKVRFKIAQILLRMIDSASVAHPILAKPPVLRTYLRSQSATRLFARSPKRARSCVTSFTTARMIMLDGIPEIQQ
jgi:filamentous hemagglutinin